MRRGIAVVGLGIMGACTLWRLAERGVQATGFERLQPGHDRGASHGETRIIRTAYYEGVEYVPLAQASFELWRELEAVSGRSLLTMTGALMIGSPDSELVTGALRSARTHGLAHEMLDAAQMQRRFPQHTFIPVPGIACACNACPHMAKNTLEKIRNCLRDLQPEVLWAPEFDKAEAVIRRSLL